MAKTFRAPKFLEVEITENGEIVGQIRVKPSGVLWSPKGAHSWYGLDLAKFAELAEKHGKKQKK